MGARNQQQIVAIDALRFLCAAMVTLFHFLTILPLADAAPLQRVDPTAGLDPRGAAWTWFGWVGVELFFVISGYVIALSARGSDQATFLRRRALRLAPVAWLCATLTAMTLLAAQAMPPGEVLRRWLGSVLFLPVSEQIDAPYWTLRVELAFYLLTALCLRGGADGRRLERIGWGLSLWSAAYWLVTLATGTASQDAIDTPLLTLLLLPHGSFFALGIALWTLRDAGTGKATFALAMLSLTSCTVEIFIHAGTMRAVPEIDATPWWPLLAFLLGIAVIAGAGGMQRLLVMTVGTPTLALLGRMTYPLYLLNLTIGAAFVALAMRAGLPGPIAIALAATLLLLAAYLVARFGEPPLRAWLARRIDAVSSRRDRRRDSLPSASPPAG